MQKNTNTKRMQTGRTMVSVDINGDGHKTRIDLNSLPLDRFIAYHGTTTDGKQVNSIHAMSLGKSMIIRSGKRGVALAATKDELEVFATKFLVERGFNVSSSVPHK